MPSLQIRRLNRDCRLEQRRGRGEFESSHGGLDPSNCGSSADSVFGFPKYNRRLEHERSLQPRFLGERAVLRIAKRSAWSAEHDPSHWNRSQIHSQLKHGGSAHSALIRAAHPFQVLGLRRAERPKFEAHSSTRSQIQSSVTQSSSTHPRTQLQTHRNCSLHSEYIDPTQLVSSQERNVLSRFERFSRRERSEWECLL